MSDSKDKNPLYRGPSPERKDTRGPRPPRRDEQRTARPPSPAYEGQERRPRSDHHAPRGESARPERELSARRPVADEDGYDQRPAKIKEFRIYGLNACLAAFKKRPESIRKLWLLESRIPKLTELLAFCVKNRIGYNVVENEDLEKLSASAHHEGVCLAMLPQAELPLSTWLMSVPAGPCLAVWLDGVGNPHNLGAILRSAAHFGVQAVLLPKHSSLANSGAAARVAEGAAEYVPLVRLGRNDNAIAQLQAAGFELVTTVVRGGSDVFNTSLPQRCVLVMGAEQAGVEAELLAASRLRVEIPGSGQVDSLNVSAATAVLLAEWRRQISR
jgi:TrmH RNA methyltransferase